MGRACAADTLFELERTLFLLYQVGGYRAATFTLSTDKRAWARLVRLMHVSFFTAADGTRAAFIVLPETKTTASWRPVGHVLRANPSGDRSRCAVHRLETLVVARLAAGADPTEPNFHQPEQQSAIFAQRVRQPSEGLHRRGGVSLHLGPPAATTSFQIRQRDQFSQRRLVAARGRQRTGAGDCGVRRSCAHRQPACVHLRDMGGPWRHRGAPVPRDVMILDGFAAVVLRRTRTRDGDWSRP